MGRNNSYICTAHNHEDQLETLMMKFLRGTNIANFVGVSNHQYFNNSLPNLRSLNTRILSAG